MSDVTQILSRIEHGDPSASEELLPLVYNELRRLAATKLAAEKPGQTLQATALVHDAYLRLVDVDQAQHWNSRGHFFGAAAEAMRRILIEQARRKQTAKQGGGQPHLELSEGDLVSDVTPDRLLALDEALTLLSRDEPHAAEVVKLRAFAGLAMDEVADALEMSSATAYRHWSYARAWLRAQTQA